MDFLAYFSTEENENRYGTIVLLVSAPDIETAGELCEKKIREEKDRPDLFNNVRSVYLDSITQIKKFSNDAKIVRYETRSTDGIGCISINPEDDTLESYQWYSDSLTDSNNEGTVITEPFISF